ncbi:hydroxyproline-rich glycoprotein family protein [Raphanus sativus]|uniref:Uncharacterized protein LOC108824097 n=1 Tax=Raphanus sativus TaxID=3726 RepID=A0A6J0KZQ9_RAPSA|nr:uncharacterized protein LOC108824097 [Raphanus sativus]KAJ4912437.1 hydroxyproline-rich glycoprotein family protein [Raphanus sativus]
MVERRSSKKTTQLGNKEDQNPRKFYSRFLFKALILAVFCSIVPVFLSQTPELANQTRLLELLHLVFVGLAVSYGLLSRRNYDGGGGSSDNDHNNTNPHVYVPKLLGVSSVFNVGHESESEPSDDSSGDRRKTKTWRSKYQMKTPEVVLSRENQTRFVDRVSSGVREKPLLLPVRSLNYSRVSSDHPGGPWERVRSKRELLKSLGDDDNSDVLPSPIPWRSRSSSAAEVESQTSIKNLATVESQPLIKTPVNLTSSSPRKSTPLPNLTTDEETVRKQRSRQPPSPPPPPPLPAFYNSASRKDNSPGVSRIVESRESVQKKKFSGGEFHPPPPPPPPPPPMDYYKSPPTKLRASSERRKSSEQKMKRNSSKKVWWSDPIAESKELRVTREDNDGRGFVGSKAAQESDDEEHRRREADVHEDDEHSEIEEKKVEEEGACGNHSDVDKKADEFIAKFREQIRLQRIESIKRSTNKISANFSK